VSTFKSNGPYFDQESPDAPIVRVLAEEDWSESYELDAGAIYECEGGRFLLVAVSGCSCWPDRGSTDQRIAEDWASVDRIAKELFGSNSAQVLDAAQATRSQARP